MTLLRRELGEALRDERTAQGRSLRQVSAAASVSLGYLSEIERGQKEASSELLTAVCGALGVPLSAVLSDVSLRIARAEAIEAGLTPLPLARAGKPVSASAA